MIDKNKKKEINAMGVHLTTAQWNAIESILMTTVDKVENVLCVDDLIEWWNEHIEENSNATYVSCLEYVANKINIHQLKKEVF